MVLGVLVASPALNSGLLADDFGQRTFILAKLEGKTDRPWWDMFVLIGQSSAELERLRFRGAIPWWSSTEVHVAFWRPLTAATHYLDHALWPERPALMHLHQLLWHGLACGLAWLLFRRLASSPAAAGAAALGFSLTHLHLSATAWLAHRNGVVVLVFALLTLLAHERWRRERERTAAVLAALAFMATLLGGELGVAVLGFIVAHALVLDDAPLGRRLLAVLPYLVVLVVWRLVYDALGYGAVGSGVYIDPLAEPGRWLALAPRRLSQMLVYALGPPGSIGGASPWRIIGALVVALALASMLGDRGAQPRARRLGFALVGLVLSLVPLTTTAAHDRVLVLASVATTLAYGELLAAALDSEPLIVRVAALVVGLCHYLLSPLAAIAVSTQVEHLNMSDTRYPIAAELDDARLRRQSLVIVHSPDLLAATGLPQARVARGLQRPNFTWVLHAEPGDPPFARQVGPRTLELEDPRGWAGSPETSLMRSQAQPFAVGDRVETLDFVVEVVRVDEGRPTEVQIEFRAPLDDPSFVVATWGGADFELCPGATACPE